jgi:hypothetical protein
MNALAAIAFGAALLAAPSSAWAIIPHNYIGFYPHQIGHVFFLISLGIFIYYLKRQGLTKDRGWLYIAVSAALLLFWNVHTLIGHFFELRVRPEYFINRDDFLRGAIRLNFVTANYIVYKMDNLILAPAFIFFYLGVKRHFKKASP